PPSDDPKAPKTEWYHTPRDKGPTWNEPFLATGAGRFLIEYGVPFFRRDRPDQVAGVVTIDFSLKDIRGLIARLDLGATGFGVVFTGKGTYLAHPDSRQVAKGSIFERPAGRTDTQMEDAARQALKGDKIGFDYKDPKSGEEAWIVFEPISSTGWALGLIMHKAEFAASPVANLRQIVTLALVLSLALLFAMGIVLRPEDGTARSWWRLTSGFSILAGSLIVLVWFLVWDLRMPRGTAVTSRVAVSRFLELHSNSLKRAEKCYVIPTGIEFDAIKFPDATTVVVSGHIWQRYPEGMPAEITRGFIFPQTADDTPSIQEVKRVKQAGEELIVWRFLAKLQQSFDPSHFPFDHRLASVRLLPAELTATIVLTPDFAGYPFLNPKALPGIDPEIHLNNWHLRRGYFNYQMLHSPTNLGMDIRAERPDTPTLHYVIDAQRNFLGPFIAYLVPAMVSAALTFFLLITGLEKASQKDLISGMSYAAGLLFIIVVAHSALRENIGAVGITYMEHMYIFLYFLVTMVIVNCYLVVRKPENVLVRTSGNLIPKLAFWPFFSGMMLLSTLWVFVYGG
ncbi:MAG: Cache 3/Cache 2 fusion domain-containing protein, partial [Planctomycetes bacterium]|nr:Cache 3/Cache 2 fusion domain-containing protein [Planctomycetota bacterium]